MKKKFLLILLSMVFLTSTGCFNKTENNIIDSMKKEISKLDSYHITGELEIINNEDKFSYDVDVAYQKDDNFKVSLKNKTNNHEQIILKNSEGVYVLTPSLNKSFKFQSDWPYNNSQIYLLQTLMNDIQNDKDNKVEKTKNGFIIYTNVDYPNNKNLVKQKIYTDKNGAISTVEILNNDDVVKMKMKFNNIDKSAKFNDDYFNLDKNMTEQTIAQTVKEIEDIIYPMYMPENTYLKSQDTISLENGERVILTFAGDNPFMLIEETVSIPEDNELTVVYGDPEILIGTIGSVTENSASWISNGIEYYAVSDTMDQEQLLEVVNSISIIPVGK